jgi:hypothetical protein
MTNTTAFCTEPQNPEATLPYLCLIGHAMQADLDVDKEDGDSRARPACKRCIEKAFIHMTRIIHSRFCSM